jgi:A/G-specific adenine glycosylase
MPPEGLKPLEGATINSLVEEVVSNWHLFRREFPWRNTSSPWHVLIAEILLLQTDAAKVSMVYPRFIELFPEPCSLLKADRQVLEDLLKPLGLYRQRADRLIKLAAYIRDKYSCTIPCSYEELKAIPGIGDYTAAAVCILACGCSAPILDTNIARVLSRAVLGKDPPRRYMYDAVLWRLSSMVKWRREALLAVVDFAAQICTARDPKCGKCPISNHCTYLNNMRQKQPP